MSQKTAALIPDNSRNALAQTIAEHLGRVTAQDDDRVGMRQKLPEVLETHGVPTLSAKRENSVRHSKSAALPAPARGDLVFKPVIGLPRSAS